MHTLFSSNSNFQEILANYLYTFLQAALLQCYSVLEHSYMHFYGFSLVRFQILETGG